MKKIIFSVIFAFMLTLTSFAFAKTANMDFDFSDVQENDWYAQSVKEAYEYGFMNGVSDRTFSPSGSFTVAQCLTVACRMKLSNEGKTDLESTGKNWYDAYVNYALSEKIIKEGQFDSYTRNITRAECAYILVQALPDELFEEINVCNYIPDVTLSDAYGKEIFMLYRAGIVGGNDDSGTFAPDSSIKRSEISAIICRIADKDSRLHKSASPGEAKYLVDDTTVVGKFGVASGWTYDNKYQTGNTSGVDSMSLIASSEGQTVLHRQIKTVSEGIFEFDANISFSGVKSGFFISLENDNKDEALRIFLNNGVFAVNAKQTATTSLPSVIGQNRTHTFVVLADLDKAQAVVYIDSAKACEVQLPDKTQISRISVGFDKGGAGSISLLSARAYSNYAVNDNFLINSACKDALPYIGWTNKGSISLSKIGGEKGEDVYSAKISAKASTDSYSQKSFDTISGNVIFEASILLPSGSDGAYISLENAGKSVVSLETKDGFLVNGSSKRSFTDNVWQFVRIEADTSVGKATLKVNGKIIGKADFSSDGFDGIKIGIKPSSDAEMFFDDVKVYAQYNHDDYPTEPKQVNKNDSYNIGVNVCNLWRNGYHGEGWEVISPFEELTPYLGYYDEGNPEVADWEIKWMAEHGIDFQHVCWYSPSADITSPVKAKSMEQVALDDGYLNAKYSDLVDFCIMWENSTKNVNSLEQFKTYLWPYFKDHYFSDERYVRLDNKALFTVWSHVKFIDSFGGVDGAKQAIEFMREDIKSLGYDGLVIWFADGDGSLKQTLLDNAKEIGADAVYPYNFGVAGSSGSYQISQLEKAESKDVYYVPGVSVGFNSVARHDTRFGMISKEQHKNVCEYIKGYLSDSSTGTWKDNTLIVSSWNEYSEGTYVAPTSSCGFEYLDNIRDVFYGTSEHNDELPTSESLDRISNIYPKHHDPIRLYRLDKTAHTSEITGQVALSFDFSDPTAREKWKAQFNVKDFAQTDLTITGTGTDKNFAITTKLTADESFGIEAKKNAVLHIRMKTSVVSSCEFYFITEQDTKWDENKHLTFPQTVSDEFVDYYVPLAECAGWTGTLKNIRIDPLMTPGDFEFSLVEIIYKGTDSNSKTVSFDGNSMSFDFDPVYDASLDDVLVTANPRKGFFSMLHAYYEYSRLNKKLLVEANGNSVLFTVDSDTALVNGKQTNLGYTLTLHDGLPVFPLKHLALLLGYNVSEKDGNTEVTTLPASLQGSVEDDKKIGTWNFNTDSDKENWALQQSEGAVTGGRLECTATGRDPAIVIKNLNINTEDFTKIKVGLSYTAELSTAKQWFQVFFLAGGETKISEASSVSQDLTTADTKGETVEITLDLSQNENWKGILTMLRIDPMYGTGTFSIDYVTLCK